MNISSYNIADVSYHYIGLRVLDAVPVDSGRRQQIDAISSSVLKFVNDKALRLMLPEPKGRFETVGEKVCQELVHFRFAQSTRTGYELTATGREALGLLESRKYIELRKRMAVAHLRTYDNLRAVVQSHFRVEFVWRPIVTPKLLGAEGYLKGLLEPTFGQDAAAVVASVSNGYVGESPKKVESILHSMIIKRIVPNKKIAVPIFTAICNRLASLRLLNIRRESSQGLEFAKSYSPCISGSPSRPWYIPLKMSLENSEVFQIYLCEPNIADASYLEILLEAIDKAFSRFSPTGGYYDIPDVRDWVCEHLMIPEAAFDDGLNHLLDIESPVLSIGLSYQGISGLRKPLVRNRRDTQIFNLIRRL